MNIQKMMKQAQEMQQKMEKAQAELENMEVEGASGAGMVKVTLTGKGIAKKVSIDKEVVDPTDIEMLEDLLVAAINDAKTKVDEKTSGAMSDAMGGMSLPPGMNMPF